VKSMTGFGSGTYSDDRLSVTIEIKAVNQRFLEMSIRMPRAYLALEDLLRKNIKEVIHRGKVDVYVTVTELAPPEPVIRIDYASLTACKRALDEASQKLFGTEATLDQICRLTTDWFSQETASIDIEGCWPVFQAALCQSLDKLMVMRTDEGNHIADDLMERVSRMNEYVDAIATRKETIIANYEERLRARMDKMLSEMGAVPDENRLLQEVAIYSDKTDFTEEVVRFHSHMLQLKGLLEESDDVGRKLDFLIQELNRETNTIGSKANDINVTEYVLKLKNEIEKIREQIQNIE